MNIVPDNDIAEASEQAVPFVYTDLVINQREAERCWGETGGVREMSWREDEEQGMRKRVGRGLWRSVRADDGGKSV